MLTVIIPAQNEAPYLNHTIDNLIRTASIRPEIIVVDNGGNGEIDPRAKVITATRNLGERVAMNLAAKAATNEFLFRIDAHCDFSPQGWDVMLAEVTGPKDLTMAVLTAIRKPWDRLTPEEQQMWLATKRAKELWQGEPPTTREGKVQWKKWLACNRTREDWVDWQRQKGHWYGQTRLIVSEHAGRKGLEAKWYGANRDHKTGVFPTMAATGCGMCLRKSWYEEIGGADEMLPPMGAIGEEFAVRTWLAGGKCQLHCDVTIGHVFGTGGYNSQGVLIAQQALYDQFGDRYDEIAGRPEFAGWDGQPVRRTDQPGKPIRTVDVIRTDTHDTKDTAGKLIRRRIERFRYLWLSNEHPGEENLTEKEVEAKYAPQGVRISAQVVYFDDAGQPVQNEPVLVTP